jgi:hypothetical protein
LRQIKVLLPLLLVLFAALSCPAQWLSASAGVSFPRGTSGPGASNDFGTSWMVAADGGIPVFPFLAVAAHYSFAQPDDVFSSASRSTNLQLNQHNFALEGRVHTPALKGWRLYGLAGPGFSYFKLAALGTSETKPMFTFGGGIERGVFPLVRLKLEVRDYVTGGLSSLIMPSGAWHRTALLAGVEIGR